MLPRTHADILDLPGAGQQVKSCHGNGSAECEMQTDGRTRGRIIMAVTGTLLANCCLYPKAFIYWNTKHAI